MTTLGQHRPTGPVIQEAFIVECIHSINTYIFIKNMNKIDKLAVDDDLSSRMGRGNSPCLSSNSEMLRR